MLQHAAASRPLAVFATASDPEAALAVLSEAGRTTASVIDLRDASGNRHTSDFENETTEVNA